MAVIVSRIENLFRSVWGKQGVKMTVPNDFMIEWDEEKRNMPKRQSTEEMKDILKGLVRSINKKKKSK